MDNVEAFSPNESILFGRDWSHAHSGSSTTYMVAGPPGSGKTTLVSALSDESWVKPALVHLEDGSANPFLSGKETLDEVDVSASQEWFLERYDQTLDRYSGQQSIILDQDPRAVALVYSRTFLRRGRLSHDVYLRQLQRCLAILSKLSALSKRHVYVLLSAPERILKDRVRGRRAHDFLSGPMGREILGSFELLFRELKTADVASCVEFSTDQADAGDIVRSLNRSIEG